MAFYSTDLLYVQRPSSQGNPHFQMDGYQLRDFVSETQLSVNDAIIDEFNDLKIKVSILQGDVIRIESNIDLLQIQLNQEEKTREREDLILKSDLDALKIRVANLEDYSDIKAFYFLQPTEEFSGTQMKVGGMAFNSFVDSDITGIKLKVTDNRGQQFTYININPGEKIEIVHTDSNNSIRKRLLFNVEQVFPPVSGSREFVELQVTYLFSTGDKTLQLLSDDNEEFIAEIFPAFDPTATVTQSYVDNSVNALDVKLQQEIDNVALTAGVSQIKAGNNIIIDPSNGKGAVTITSTVVPPSYQLPTASAITKGGVKVSSIDGTIHQGIIGISNEKLTIQESTNARAGVNYKGQCAINNSNATPNPENYQSGTLVWNRTKGHLYIIT